MKYARPTQGQPSASGQRHSTATEAQHDRILSALRLRPHTSYELRKLGCYQCPARVKELREQGYSITTERVMVWDDEGYAHRNVALYSLHGEPGMQENRHG